MLLINEYRVTHFCTQLFHCLLIDNFQLPFNVSVLLIVSCHFPDY